MVVACTMPDTEGGGVIVANCEMNLVVQAPGVEPTPIEHKAWVKGSKWPTPGMTLPLLVDRANPTRVKILWDKVPKAEDRIDAMGDMIAAAMRGQAPGQMPPGVQVVQMGGDQPEGADHIAQLERLAQLHESGALSDEEFEAEKRKLLDA